MMRPWMCYSGEIGASEGAALVFAYTHAEAKKIAWWTCQGMLFEEFIEVRVNLITADDFIMAQADPAKLAAGEAHCIDNPISCDGCEQWGKPMATPTKCEDCKHDDELDAKHVEARL